VTDPAPGAWRRADGDILFYDGGCGLCHLAVRLTLAADRRARFHFAPLGGETFVALVPVGERQDLPDSLVLRTSGGTLLTRWAAVVAVLRRLGGPWPALAALGRLVPRRLGDALYDAVARVRHRLFTRPRDLCPLVPGALRARILP
jgi:predicted DCC family thiol-disulfide oxidoreductase YuxK